jgi:hypothetical protein
LHSKLNSLVTEVSGDNILEILRLALTFVRHLLS